MEKNQKKMPNKKMLKIEIIYSASENTLFHYFLKVKPGTSVFDAVLQSPLLKDCDTLDIEKTTIGVFSKKIINPKIQLVKKNDRIELYRPLIADPKKIRIKKAKKKC